MMVAAIEWGTLLQTAAAGWHQRGMRVKRRTRNLQQSSGKNQYGSEQRLRL
jgi:hypothetical protein